jgi:hypothetical protein
MHKGRQRTGKKAGKFRCKGRQGGKVYQEGYQGWQGNVQRLARKCTGNVQRQARKATKADK